MIVPLTAIYAVVLALMTLALAFRVVAFRRRDRVGLGDDGSRDLRIAMRAHANFVEYAPLFLVLLFVAEINGVPVNWLHGIGMVFVLGRFAHAWGMVAGDGGVHPGRMVGILTTWLAIVALAGLLCWNLTLFA